MICFSSPPRFRSSSGFSDGLGCATTTVRRRRRRFSAISWFGRSSLNCWDPSIFPRAVGDLLDVVAYAWAPSSPACGGTVESWSTGSTDALRPAPDRAIRSSRQTLRLAWKYCSRAANWRDAATRFGTKYPLCKAPSSSAKATENFSHRCLTRNPAAQVTCVDASASMLEVARNRLLRATLPLERVQFIRAEVPAWKPPAERYDLVATHFFPRLLSA